MSDEELKKEGRRGKSRRYKGEHQLKMRTYHLLSILQRTPIKTKAKSK